MKKLPLLLALCFFFFTGEPAFSQAETKANDPALILKLTDNYSEKVVQVSFDGVDAATGQLQIIDLSSNRVIKHMDVFEIVQAPYYSSINIQDFRSGEYSFILTTKIRSYSSTLIIQ